MQAVTVYMEHHNQVTGIVYRNISAEYVSFMVKMEDASKVIENDQATILWDFQIHADKMVMANQPDVVVADKQQKRTIVIDVTVPSDTTTKQKEHKKLEKYQGLKEEKI